MRVWAPGNPDILPFAGERHAIDGFDHFWQAFFGMMERADKQIILDSMQLIAEGNKVVCLAQELAFVRELRQPNSPAPPSPFPLCFVFTFERGKVIQFEDHFDAGVLESTIRMLQGMSS